MVNAPQKFAQTVLIERNRQVLCFCEILRFCKQQLDYQLLSFKRCWYPKSSVYSKTADSDTVSTYQVSSVQLVTDKKLEAFNKA